MRVRRNQQMESAALALSKSDPEALFTTMQQLAPGAEVEEEIFSSGRNTTMNSQAFRQVLKEVKHPEADDDEDDQSEEEIKKTFAMKLESLNQKIKLFRKEFYTSKREDEKRKQIKAIRQKHLKIAKER